MGWRKFWGLCEHDWKQIKLRFLPPSSATAKGLDDHTFNKMVWGYTIRTFQCKKCGKHRVDEVIGDVRKNVEICE